MKNLLSLSLLLFSSFAMAKTNLIFKELSRDNNKIIYESQNFEKPRCAMNFDCKIFLGHIYDSYTVKFYIPFIVMFLIYIFLQRKIKDIQINEVFAAKHLITMQVAHDIKSPVTAINVASENIELNPQVAQEILNTSVERLNSITDSLLPGYNKPEIFNIVESISNTIKEKEFPIDFQEQSSFYINANKTDFERVISNILNNAHEAKPINNKIRIKIKNTAKEIYIIVLDTGPGIPKKVLNNLGEIGNTFGKKTGSGLGLSHMVSFIRENGGKFKINSDQSGTEIKMTFKKVT